MDDTLQLAMKKCKNRIEVICNIKSLLTDYGYTVKFVTCEDDDFYELVTELVITWYN